MKPSPQSRWRQCHSVPKVFSCPFLVLSLTPSWPATIDMENLTFQEWNKLAIFKFQCSDFGEC